MRLHPGSFIVVKVFRTILDIEVPKDLRRDGYLKLPV
jgi:hypothetical protein